MYLFIIYYYTINFTSLCVHFFFCRNDNFPGWNKYGKLISPWWLLTVNSRAVIILSLNLCTAAKCIINANPFNCTVYYFRINIYGVYHVIAEFPREETLANKLLIHIHSTEWKFLQNKIYNEYRNYFQIRNRVRTYIVLMCVCVRVRVRAR